MRYKDEAIGVYQPDFVVDNKIVVEIKSVLTMPKVFEKRLFYYLEASGYKLGYLINFGSDKINIKRRLK